MSVVGEQEKAEEKRRGKVIYEVLWLFQSFFIFSLLPLRASRLTFKGLGRDIERSWQKFRSTQIQTGGKYQLESCLFLVSLHPLAISFPKWKNICLYRVLALRCLQCKRQTHKLCFQSSLYSENRERSRCFVFKTPQQNMASPFPRSDEDRIPLLGRGGNINEPHYKYQ